MNINIQPRSHLEVEAIKAADAALRQAGLPSYSDTLHLLLSMTDVIAVHDLASTFAMDDGDVKLTLTVVTSAGHLWNRE